MSWVTIIWSMAASACLTLGALHLLVWIRKPRAWAHLAFFLSAASTAAFAGCELWVMHSATPGDLAVAVRWAQVPVWGLVVSLVVFVRLYLRAGRLWLAWTVCGLRTLALALNFIVTPNLNYREITAVRRLSYLGEVVSVAEGVPNPWMLVAHAGLVLLVIFVVDATLTVWRRGDRRQALTVGGSIVLFTLGGSAQAILVLWRFVDAPVMASVFYQGLVAVMGYQLSLDVIRAERLSDELKESQQGMQLCAAAANLALWTWDIPRNLIWATPEGRPLYGIPRHEAITVERFVATLHTEDRAPVQEELQRALRGDGQYQVEYRVALPGGLVRWMSTRGKVEFGADGRPLRMRGVSLDITERKVAEQEAQLHHNEITHLSRVSTLGEISGSLAHQLHQPLGAILANAVAAELHLQRQPPDLEEVRAILADIRKDDLRAGEIIQGIREFLGRRHLERQSLEVAQLVQETLRLIRGDAAARHTAVSVDIPLDLPRVTGDRIQLQQVLLNLLVNGMDAMSTLLREERRLVIRARSFGPHGVELTVSDAGTGIPPEDLPRVFEPFHTTKPDGLGLGLSICRSIVEAYGGVISIENNPDRGATARFTVPLS